MKKQFILTIDQSTSGTKAILFNCAGEIIAKTSFPHTQIYPQPGWVEHNPIEIYDNVMLAALSVLEIGGITPDKLAALTITNQRETAVIWDAVTGLPVHPAIVWQCQRTADTCEVLKNAGFEKLIQSKAGLLLDPYFSASKWSWILQHIPAAAEKLLQGRLLAGTIDSWLLWKLTGGKTHATDYTNASRTSLFNIHTLQWDEELCALFKVPISILPEVKNSDECFGYTDPSGFFGLEIPITGIIGDSQAALFGNHCFEIGSAKATFGTGTSVMMNVGEHCHASERGLVAAIAWGMSGKITYALEAVIRTTGDSLNWLRDNMGLFSTFEEMEVLSKETPACEGVYLVPAFVGLGAPYWDSHARAAITGINRSTRKGHIVRAALESIAYQVKDAVILMQSSSGINLNKLYVDGGASGNATLMQFQADMLGTQVIKSGIAEVSALGSMYLGGIYTGWWSSAKEIVSQSGLGNIYDSKMEIEQREVNYAGWKRAVTSVLVERTECTIMPSHHL
ncbi:glycerol kinase 2 [Paenibacillus terrae HPL-003]|uniref:ATP:glycerol 3-phosphotransferase n=1 Tax=Paenibacillus terrae (strain HPL-003) TaxID=985665 RepID=G7VQ84_PAETH|nr:glycerol kinase GlpK [Paenibacillus terrae]AET61153.1 glycerol kinase 2 [Paenibacillus terrae HPL-003]